MQNFKENFKPMTIDKKIPKSLFIPEIPEEEKIIPSTQKSRKGRKPIKKYKHAFLNNLFFEMYIFYYIFVYIFNFGVNP